MTTITQAECIARFKNAHGDKYDYSKVVYKGQYTKVCIICPIHGEFWQTPKGHWLGRGCRKCKQNAPLTTDEVVSRFKQKHDEKYDYAETKYINETTHIEYICPTHGIIKQLPWNHLKYGCPKCAKEREVFKRSSNKEEFIKKSIDIHGDKYNYSKVNYINNHTRVCIICPTHGEFWQTPMKHLIGRGCHLCKTSHLERSVAKLLKTNNIDYEVQKRFKWLGKQSLDFFLPKYNIAIECQGKQHFEENEFFTNLDKIREWDEKKRILCEEHNIKILYYTNFIIDFPYKVYTNEDELLNSIIS